MALASEAPVQVACAPVRQMSPRQSTCSVTDAVPVSDMIISPRRRANVHASFNDGPDRQVGPGAS